MKSSLRQFAAHAMLMSAIVISSLTSEAYLVPGPSGGGQGDPGRPGQYVPPTYCDRWGNCNNGTNQNAGGDLRPGPNPYYPRPQPGPSWPNQPGGWGHDHDGWHGGGGFPRPYPAPNPNPYRPPVRPPMPPPPVYNPGPQSDVQAIFIGRSVRDERLVLNQLSRLADYYPGWRIVSITADTTPNSSSRTTVRLAINNQVVATQINPGYQINIFPERWVTVNSFDNIELWINGSTYINQIQIHLER